MIVGSMRYKRGCIFIFLDWKKEANVQKARMSVLRWSLGDARLGFRFVSFVRAYARSGCLVSLDRKSVQSV